MAIIDLCLVDEAGSQLVVEWNDDGGAEIAVRGWTVAELDREQLIRLTAHLICGLSKTGETVDRIIAALEGARTEVDDILITVRRPLNAPFSAEEA